ncbi:hypothetical protein GF327_02320 [Candidatus Woesearchaeota archaeon]|nr:hypothetical protein [Candidatus Woesearchaeota archaeon]
MKKKSSRIFQEADELCNEIAILDKGKLVVHDTVSNLKDSLKIDIIDIKVKDYSKIRKKFKKIQMDKPN